MGEWRLTKLGTEPAKRLRADVPVRITTVEPERDHLTGDSFCRMVEESTADLSRGGAFIRSWEPLAAGRKVVVEIDLPASGQGDDARPACTLEMTARVAWTQRRVTTLSAPSKPIECPGYGVEFVSLRPGVKGRLDRFLDETANVSCLPCAERIQREAAAPGGSGGHPEGAPEIQASVSAEPDSKRPTKPTLRP